MTDQAGPGLRALVYAALPANATPTNTACHPIHRHVLEHAQGDIVELTKEKMSAEFGAEPHVVITIKDGDLDPATDGDLIGPLTNTAGGVLVFGVSYRLGGCMNFTEESCPECGSENKVQLSRADEADAQGYFAVLYQCKDCGTAWDAYTR